MRCIPAVSIESYHLRQHFLIDKQPFANTQDRPLTIMPFPIRGCTRFCKNTFKNPNHFEKKNLQREWTTHLFHQEGKRQNSSIAAPAGEHMKPMRQLENWNHYNLTRVNWGRKTSLSFLFCSSHWLSQRDPYSKVQFQTHHLERLAFQ